MATTFDPAKPVRTSGGRAARIIGFLDAPDFPIIAIVAAIDEGFHETVETYRLDGGYDAGGRPCSWDLVNVEE